MGDFGLAGEGKTDHAVLENVLIGFYSDIDDLDDEINHLQPFLDETDKAVCGELDDKRFGGWSRLLAYLGHKDFRKDVRNHRFLIVQVDTDVAGHKGFDVVLMDGNNKPLSVEEVVANVKNRLIEKIDGAQEGFYDEFKEKIIFAISVDSIECWLFHLHNKDLKRAGITNNCEYQLEQILKKDRKNPALTKEKPVYDKLSRLFYKKNGKKIAEVAKVDTSFRIFIENLKSLPYPP